MSNCGVCADKGWYEAMDGTPFSCPVCAPVPLVGLKREREK